MYQLMSHTIPISYVGRSTGLLRHGSTCTGRESSISRTSSTARHNFLHQINCVRSILAFGLNDGIQRHNDSVRIMWFQFRTFIIKPIAQVLVDCRHSLDNRTKRISRRKHFSKLLFHLNTPSCCYLPLTDRAHGPIESAPSGSSFKPSVFVLYINLVGSPSAIVAS